MKVKHPIVFPSTPRALGHINRCFFLPPGRRVESRGRGDKYFREEEWIERLSLSPYLSDLLLLNCAEVWMIEGEERWMCGGQVRVYRWKRMEGHRERESCIDRSRQRDLCREDIDGLLHAPAALCLTGASIRGAHSVDGHIDTC